MPKPGGEAAQGKPGGGGDPGAILAAMAQSGIDPMAAMTAFSGGGGGMPPGQPSLGPNRISQGGQMAPPMPVFQGGRMTDSFTPPPAPPGMIRPPVANAPPRNMPVDPRTLR